MTDPPTTRYYDGDNPEGFTVRWTPSRWTGRQKRGLGHVWVEFPDGDGEDIEGTLTKQEAQAFADEYGFEFAESKRAGRVSPPLDGMKPTRILLSLVVRLACAACAAYAAFIAFASGNIIGILTFGIVFGVIALWETLMCAGIVWMWVGHPGYTGDVE